MTKLNRSILRYTSVQRAAAGEPTMTTIGKEVELLRKSAALMETDGLGLRVNPVLYKPRCNQLLY